MRIAVVIFTRNELKNSKRIYAQVPIKSVDAVYVIDGNSTDGTVEFWKSKRVKVFGQVHKGVGGAYESAFKNTTEDSLIFFHPDGNMDPRDIPEFVKRLARGEEFIVASRTINGAVNEEDGQKIKYRKWSVQLMAFVVSLIWGNKGNKTSDLTQGYRAITRKAYQKLKIKIPNAVAPDTQQIIRALKKDIQISEFSTREGKRVYGETSMKSFKTSWENIKVFLNELASSLR